jgi:hypothetical protein
MTYNLTKINFSNKTKASIPVNFEVKSLCCKDEEIYFIYNGGIGKIEKGIVDTNWCYELCYTEKPPDLTNLSSITYCSKSDSLYVVSGGGSQILKINLFMGEIEELLSPNQSSEIKERYLSTTQSPTEVVSDGFRVIWSVRDCHRCFKIEGGVPSPFIGCGKSGFSISNLKCSKICHPTGVTIMENTVCFADSGNNCLRGTRNDSIFNIIEDCKKLRDVFYYNKKLFFLSNNAIHMLSSEGDKTHLFEVYKVEHNIQSFCPTGKDCLYILEENDASTPEETENCQST